MKYTINSIDYSIEELNNILSLDRANQVSNYFVNKGIPKSRITTKGQGELEPLLTNDTEENKRKNRNNI